MKTKRILGQITQDRDKNYSALYVNSEGYMVGTMGSFRVLENAVHYIKKQTVSDDVQIIDCTYKNSGMGGYGIQLIVAEA